MMLGLFCTLACYALGLALMPKANSKFQDIRTFFRDKYASVLLQEEVFNNPIDGVTVYVRARDEANNLSGVMMHDSRDPKQTPTMIAEEGEVEQTASGPKFYLQHGLRQQMHADGQISWLAFDDYAIELAFYGQTAEREQRPEERTINELFDREGLTDAQANAFRAEANQRIAWPILALTLPLFALATLFSSEFNRRGQGRRILVASVGMGVIVLVYFAVRNLLNKHGELTPLLYSLMLGTLGASVYLLVSGRVIRFSRRATPPVLAGES
jgi:lipopolysaccharide export system permease protein